MTFYRYRAVGKEGSLYKGVLEVSSPTELRRHLQERGFSLISYSRNFIDFKEITRMFSQKITSRILWEFCLHLEQLERAGIPLKECLEELSRIQENLALKQILLEVIKDVESGLLFSKALAKHSFIFDSVFVGLMGVGEKTGRLSFVLPQLVNHLKWTDEIQAQIQKALRYPLIMSTLLLGVVFILMTVLVPELIAFIKNFKADLPLSTQILIALSSFLSQNALGLLGGLGIGFAFMMVCFRYHPEGRFWKDYIQDVLPLIGSLRHKLALVQFCHLFAVMFGGGIDVLQALQTARQVLGKGRFPQALKEVERRVYEGQSLSGAFEQSNFFPSMVIRMIKMGEHAGTLHLNLLYIKEYLDTALKREVDDVVGLIEPLLILGLGLFMAWIVYALFLPLYDILVILDY